MLKDYIDFFRIMCLLMWKNLSMLLFKILWFSSCPKWQNINQIPIPKVFQFPTTDLKQVQILLNINNVLKLFCSQQLFLKLCLMFPFNNCSRFQFTDVLFCRFFLHWNFDETIRHFFCEVSENLREINFSSQNFSIERHYKTKYDI